MAVVLVAAVAAAVMAAHAAVVADKRNNMIFTKGLMFLDVDIGPFSYVKKRNLAKWRIYDPL